MMNHQDEPETALRMRELTVRIYKEYSILPAVVTLRSMTRELDFLKFALRVPLPEDWLTPSYIPDVLFHDLGRSIGLSERTFLIEKMKTDGTSLDLERLTLDAILENIFAMQEEGYDPSALILPIDLHQEVYSQWLASGRFVVRYGPGEHVVIGGRTIRLYWSNVFAPFKNCFIVNREFAEWIAKPTVDRRLQVTYSRPHDGHSITEVTVETRFYYQPLERRALRVLNPVEATSAQPLPSVVGHNPA